jgi:hypothetical protein
MKCVPKSFHENHCSESSQCEIKFQSPSRWVLKPGSMLYCFFFWKVAFSSKLSGSQTTSNFQTLLTKQHLCLQSFQLIKLSTSVEIQHNPLLILIVACQLYKQKFGSIFSRAVFAVWTPVTFTHTELSPVLYIEMDVVQPVSSVSLWDIIKRIINNCTAVLLVLGRFVS